MKLLLIYPPHNDVALAPSNFEPLALEVLAATVPDQEIIIFDMRFESFVALEKLILDFRPDITGITINNSLHLSSAYELLDTIHKTDPNIHVVIGGHHPTSVPSDFFREHINAIFTGWADKSFPAYIKALEKGLPTNEIPGIILLKNGLPLSIKKNKYDLLPEEIPSPNRNLTKKYTKRYRNELGQKTGLINTARGCPFRCKFCSVWTAVEGNHLVRPAEDVFLEIQSLPKTQKRIFFADDNTFIDTQNAEKLYDLIKKSGIKRKYSGYCRTDTIVRHPELLKKWKKIGLDNLCVGFETIDEDGLKKLKKSNHIDNNESAAEILHQIGIPFRSYFLVNTNFEEKDFKKISNYVDRLNLINPMFTILTPLPGTELFNEEGTKINRSYDFFDYAHWVLPTKLNEHTFFQNYVGLYDYAYSYKRNIILFYKKMRQKISLNEKRNQALQFIPPFRLILLNLAKDRAKQKLYRQYFG